MRILPLVLGLSLAGCITGEIGTVGGGGDDMGGGGGGGDGSGSGSGSDNTAVPRVDVTVSAPTVTTDLNVETPIVVTATGANGFSGDVTLAVTGPMGWATLQTSTLTLAVDGTATTNLILNVPANAATLASSLMVTATSSASPSTASIAVTANPTAIVMFTEVNGNCSYPTYPVNNPLRIKAGRMLKIVNGTTQPMRVHVDGGTGIDHEAGTTAPGEAYTGTADIVDGQASFYCHAQAGVITEANGTPRPYLRVEQ